MLRAQILTNTMKSMLIKIIIMENLLFENLSGGSKSFAVKARPTTKESLAVTISFI